MAFAPLHIKTATFYNCHFCYSSSQSPPVLSRSEWKMPTVSLPYLLLFLSCLTASSTLSFCRDPLAWFIFMLDFVCLYCGFLSNPHESLSHFQYWFRWHYTHNFLISQLCFSPMYLLPSNILHNLLFYLACYFLFC